MVPYGSFVTIGADERVGFLAQDESAIRADQGPEHFVDQLF